MQSHTKQSVSISRNPQFFPVSLIVVLCSDCEPFSFEHSTCKTNKDPRKWSGKVSLSTFDHFPLLSIGHHRWKQPSRKQLCLSFTSFIIIPSPASSISCLEGKAIMIGGKSHCHHPLLHPSLFCFWRDKPLWLSPCFICWECVIGGGGGGGGELL